MSNNSIRITGFGNGYSGTCASATLKFNGTPVSQSCQSQAEKAWYAAVAKKKGPLLSFYQEYGNIGIDQIQLLEAECDRLCISRVWPTEDPLAVTYGSNRPVFGGGSRSVAAMPRANVLELYDMRFDLLTSLPEDKLELVDKLVPPTPFLLKLEEAFPEGLPEDARKVIELL